MPLGCVLDHTSTVITSEWPALASRRVNEVNAIQSIDTQMCWLSVFSLFFSVCYSHTVALAQTEKNTFALDSTKGTTRITPRTTSPKSVSSINQNKRHDSSRIKSTKNGEISDNNKNRFLPNKTPAHTHAHGVDKLILISVIIFFGAPPFHSGNVLCMLCILCSGRL